MLSLKPVLRVEIGFLDRGGNRAQMSYCLPSSTPIDTAISSSFHFASLAAAISDAAVQFTTIRYEARDASPPAPGDTSDCSFGLALFYSNGEDTEPITIPSPNPLWLEQSGRFAGIRFDLANPTVVPLADALTTALLATVGPDAQQWERVLIVGGRYR